jgi:hypothetical protein
MDRISIAFAGFGRLLVWRGNVRFRFFHSSASAAAASSSTDACSSKSRKFRKVGSVKER